MGYSVRVLAIDFNHLSSLPRSRDAALLATLRPQLEEAWDQDEDDEFEGDEEDELRAENGSEDDDYAPPIRPAEALEQILNGTVPPQPFGGEAYWVALAIVYMHLGEDVGEVHLSSHEMQHLEEVEKALKACGATEPLSLSSLVYRGTPMPVPAAEPFPMLGYLTPQEVRDASDIYDRISLLQMTPGLRRTAEDLGGWLRAAKEKGLGLVGILA